MTDYKELLRRMCAVMSVSGHEKRAVRELLPLVEKYFDSATVDGVGNVILLKKCGREGAPRIMLDAHFDEIGMAVSGICEGGFVKVEPSGGFDCSVLSSTEMVIYGKEKVYGVFSVTPPHLAKKEDEGKRPTFDKLRIDTGYDKEELEKIISVGDPVGYRATGCDLSCGVIAGRGFDDKSCAAALICAAAEVPADELAGDVYVVLSSREEVGGGGATCAAAAIDPDYAVVTDVNFAAAPGVEARESGKRGGGPMISLSAVTCRRLTEQIIGVAEERGIPYSPVVESSNTGTNANTLVLAGDGVPAAVVSLPLGGMHTFSETLSLGDAERFIELIGAVIRDRDIAREWREARERSRGVFDRLYGEGGGENE